MHPVQNVIQYLSLKVGVCVCVCVRVRACVYTHKRIEGNQSEFRRNI
jgi:hypothetical protein